MEISDVHEAHQCKISWLAVSKITTNEITAFSELLVWSDPSYDGWKEEGSWYCWGIGLACTNVPEQVVMMRYDRSDLVFGGKASSQGIRLWLRCVVFIGCFHCKLNHRTFSCVDYVANDERGVGLFGTVRSNTEALTTRPANKVLRWCSVCCLFDACMYVCVFDLGYHYPLLYQGLSVERVIFLDTRYACFKQILRERERERELVWSNSNTDAAAVDLILSIFDSPLVGCFTIFSFFMFFFNRSSGLRKF